MTGALAAMAGSGGISGLDRQTVTTGTSGKAASLNRVRGFLSGSLGAINDGTSDIYGGAAITQFVWDEGSGSYEYRLNISGAANSGWTSVYVGSKRLDRASATFAGGSWRWSTSDGPGSQAFGVSGDTVNCIFV